MVKIRCRDADKRKNFHITIQGHFKLIVPDCRSLLLYCFEIAPVNDTLHTHVGVNLSDGMSKDKLIDWIVLNNGNLSRKDVDVKIHPRWESILGYHIGLGDKECCTKL